MPTSIKRTGCCGSAGRTSFTSRSKSTAPYSPQECCAPCPACGEIDCFCRPRFFAGQLLTDEDLNRLEQYVVEKNRLHNRYLHGHGIVCGLDVQCNPCDDQGVIVTTGYALSPCGDDIVVCKDTCVNVCDLIQECCKPAQPDCDPLNTRPGTPPPAGSQDWVLAICYDEAPSRGVAALRADVQASCCSKCSCGGSSSCGCGCSSSKAASTPKKKQLAQCEPTLTCETFKFVVYRYGQQAAPDVSHEILRKEIASVVSRLPQAPNDTAELLAWSAYGNNYRDVVWSFLAEDFCVSDEDKRRITGMSAPDTASFVNNKPGYVLAIKNYVGNVTVGLMAYLAPRICSLFKLPCPVPVDRNCIPLAKITVRQPDCRVISICEVSVREYVLSALLNRFYESIRSKLPQILDKYCCNQTRQLTPDVLGKRIADRINTFDNSARLNVLRALEGSGAKPLESRTLLEGAFATPARDVDVETLALGLLGATDASGKPYVAPEELADPYAFLFASQVLRPTLEAALPASWSGLLGVASKLGANEVAGIANLAGTISTAPSATFQKELETLRKTVTNLEKESKAHKATIAELQRRLDTR